MNRNDGGGKCCECGEYVPSRAGWEDWHRGVECVEQGPYHSVTGTSGQVLSVEPAYTGRAWYRIVVCNKCLGVEAVAAEEQEEAGHGC